MNTTCVICVNGDVQVYIDDFPPFYLTALEVRIGWGSPIDLAACLHRYTMTAQDFIDNGYTKRDFIMSYVKQTLNAPKHRFDGLDDDE